MRQSALTFFFLAITISVGTGCGSTILEPGMEVGPTDGTADLLAPDAGTTDLPDPGTTELTAIILKNEARQGGLPGVDVCAYLDGKKSDHCTQTDEHGRFTITLPNKTRTGLFFDITGREASFVPLWLDRDHHPKFPAIALWDDAYAKAVYEAGGGTYPLGAKGQLHVGVDSTPGYTGGQSFSIEPQGGFGPVYWSESGKQLDPSLTGMEPNQWGVVLDLAPGQYKVTVTGKSCVLWSGWPTSPPTRDHTTEVEVFAGYPSWVGFTCD